MRQAAQAGAPTLVAITGLMVRITRQVLPFHTLARLVMSGAPVATHW